MPICANGWGLINDLVLHPTDKEIQMIAHDYFLDVDPEFAAHILAGRPVIHRLGDSYDWAHAFEYAGQHDEYSTHGNANIAVAHPSKDAHIPTIPFDTGMVKKIHAIDEGINGQQSWLCVGTLWDGRAFALKAWCDYTGWD